ERRGHRLRRRVRRAPRPEAPPSPARRSRMRYSPTRGRPVDELTRPARRDGAMLAALRRDIRAVRERDPAARSTLEVMLCYPGVHALAFHRLAPAMWRRGWTIPARFLSHVSRFVTGIEIHPAAKLGPGLFIDHGMGVVIGETAEGGENVTLRE